MSIDHDSLRDSLKGAELVLADPPWEFGRRGASNGWRSSARLFYRGMSTDELISMDVGRYCADDCILLMWSSAQHLPHALKIMKSWQFQYKTVFQTWIKTTKKGTPCMGLGRYSRSSSEFLLLGIKGKVQKLLSPTANDVLGVIFAPRTKHSQKSDQAILRINTRFAPCRKRVELFCRGHPPSGWVGWGDEMEDSGDRYSSWRGTLRYIPRPIWVPLPCPPHAHYRQHPPLSPTNDTATIGGDRTEVLGGEKSDVFASPVDPDLKHAIELVSLLHAFLWQQSRNN